jgi:hypothetical protein
MRDTDRADNIETRAGMGRNQCDMADLLETGHRHKDSVTPLPDRVGPDQAAQVGPGEGVIAKQASNDARSQTFTPCSRAELLES